MKRIKIMKEFFLKIFTDHVVLVNIGTLGMMSLVDVDLVIKILVGIIVFIYTLCKTIDFINTKDLFNTKKKKKKCNKKEG